MKVGVIGNGFVGGATQLLKCKSIEVVVWDILPDKRVPLTLELSDLAECDFIFICVPTPMTVDNSCHTGIVEKVVNNLHEARIDFSKTYVVIRSTVPPGTSSRLGCYFMPEFLTEKNWKNDFYNCENWIVGKYDLDTDYFQDLLTSAKNADKIKYNKMIVVSTTEGEMIKYSRNAFLATKISFFNEIEEICKHNGLNYDIIKHCTSLDTRIGSSHMDVPGYDGKRGFGGTCLPKDINSLNNFMSKKCGIKSYILDAVCKRNDERDRPDKDWHNDRTIC